MPGLPHPKLAIAAFALLAAGAVAQSPSPTSLPPIAAARATESYAIYSLLISDGSVGDISLRDQQVAIADTTLTTIDDGNAAAEPDSQLQRPPGGGSAFQEAVQDYHARSQERVQLEHRFFQGTRSWRLLNAKQVAQFRKTLSGYAGIAFFSEVYFNAKQTAALVYTDNLCRNSCPGARWIYLEKRDGQWTHSFSSTNNSADIYAIYSLLLRGDPYPGLPQKQGPLAIADTTINITDMNPAIPPDGQLQPPPNNAEAFQEAVQDFRTRRFERLQLKRSFHLDVDYTLLNSGDVAAYKSTQTGYPAVNFFSEVYFNGRQTAALVYRNVFCGRLCANGQWIYLEKQGSQWVRRSGLNI
jgi:hypothetical protein